MHENRSHGPSLGLADSKRRPEYTRHGFSEDGKPSKNRDRDQRSLQSSPATRIPKRTTSSNQVPNQRQSPKGTTTKILYRLGRAILTLVNCSPNPRNADTRHGTGKSPSTPFPIHSSKRAQSDQPSSLRPSTKVVHVRRPPRGPSRQRMSDRGVLGTLSSYERSLLEDIKKEEGRLKVVACMQSPLSRAEESGYIYCFRKPNSTYYKVGRAKNVQKRLDQWRSCGYVPLEKGSFPKGKTMCANTHRIERLIHLELEYRFGRVKMHCSQCRTDHIEWFGGKWSDIEKVIIRWVKFSEIAYGYVAV